jgi:hypothetical protein
MMARHSANRTASSESYLGIMLWWYLRWSITAIKKLVYRCKLVYHCSLPRAKRLGKARVTIIRISKY